MADPESKNVTSISTGRRVTEEEIAEIRAKNKGKMLETESSIVEIADIDPTNTNQTLEAKVYRKWIPRNVPDPNATGMCFILLDRKGHAIQANVEVRDIKQYDATLQLNSCYRIQGFGCKRTDNWQRTLENDITLLFGWYTKVTPFEDDTFPAHYFNFTAYNELGQCADTRDAMLTDYIGNIRNVSRIKEFGGPMTNRILRKNVEIQNLNGNSVRLSLWNEMATSFELQMALPLEQPVIIAASSCLVKRYAGYIQLSATPATYYYLNPVVDEASHIRAVYDDVLATVPRVPLLTGTAEVEESGDNQVLTISELWQMNPESLTQQQRFTTEAVIMTIEEDKGWYLNKCRTCGQKIQDESPHWHCQEPGTKIIPNYIYCFKAVIADVTGSLLLTCFSPHAEKLLPACSEVLNYIPDPDPYKAPPILKDLEHTKHRFVLHFGKGSKRNFPRFVLDDATEPGPPALPPTMAAPTLPPLAKEREDKGENSVSTPKPSRAESMSPTEISTTTLTPPITSTEAVEKEHQEGTTVTTTTRRQLFQTPPDETETRDPKRAKTD